eukprot:TRINITY_DN5772_c0_g1_i1.p1 TRINITY_DN5772_c0_g1~~TRINITY_DN5772_c0_g1_i1.p1  ORF type:complete len:151 (-),score=27.19 TRINITY_DN5772_c0_g1_i1:157-609(-)
MAFTNVWKKNPRLHILGIFHQKSRPKILLFVRLEDLVTSLTTNVTAILTELWEFFLIEKLQVNGFVTKLEKRWMNDVAAAGKRMLEEKGVESLPFGGKRLLTETNGERMEKLVQRLVAAGKSLPPSPSKETAVCNWMSQTAIPSFEVYPL